MPISARSASDLAANSCKGYDAPPAPHLAAASDTGTIGDNVTSVVAPTITGSGAEAWAQIELYVGDRLAGSGWADGGGDWTIGDGVPGPVTRRLRQALVDVQQGRSPDPDGWLRPVPPAR